MFYTTFFLLQPSLLSMWIKILLCHHSMEGLKQYFSMVLFIMLYRMVLMFESVDEILKCDHSNESY